MKPINLLSLISAKDKLSTPVFNLYLSNFGISIKEREIEDLRSLLHQILELEKELDILDNFYVGYSINQIDKEFDLLRFGEENVINIELKWKNTGDRIKKQLQRNKYYLEFLNKKVLNFTYVSEDNKLFYLDANDELEEVEITFLVSKLNEQKLIDIPNIHNLFNPSNYLVSPFNSTEAFLQNKYFLTDHQEYIKNEILKINNDDGPCYVAIEGAAGTGKTLLIYDIAKEYRNSKKKVLIVHCGYLNNGHFKLIVDHGWEILEIKEYKLYNFSDYDVIIFDETQRIYKNQLDKILHSINDTNVKCIFSYDPKQCLSIGEIESDIPGYIKSKLDPVYFGLTEKIRTNKEIASFIKKLFNIKYTDNIKDYSNIEIQYFKTPTAAKKYIQLLEVKGWKVINYTPSRFDSYPYYRFQNRLKESAHKVIGQEFDCVVAVMDEYFYYNENGYLDIRGYTPYYHMIKMLFQIVTRTRKKLAIIIINNEGVLEKILNILK